MPNALFEKIVQKSVLNMMAKKAISRHAESKSHVAATNSQKLSKPLAVVFL